MPRGLEHAGLIEEGAALSRYYVLKNVGKTLAFEMCKMAVNNELTKVYYLKVPTCNLVI
jgi:hypothetical protein